MQPPPSACDKMIPRPSMPTSFAPKLDLPLPPYPQFINTDPPAGTPYKNPFTDSNPLPTPVSPASPFAFANTTRTAPAYDSLAGVKRKRAPTEGRSFRPAFLGTDAARPGEDTPASSTEEYYHDEPEVRPPPPAKRRILSVVGSTVGGVLRGAWEMVRPRLWGMSQPAMPATAPAPLPTPPTPLEDATEKAEKAEDDKGIFAGWEAKSVSLTPEPEQLGEKREEREEVASATRWVVVQPTATEQQPSQTRKRGATVPGGRTGRMAAPRRAGLRKSALTATRIPSGRRNSVGAGRRSAEDDEMDEYMRRVDKQMKDLIRQGKEALGAKVEVEYDDEDMF